MPANTVVETFDILEYGLPSLPSCLERSACDAFAFQGPEKGFGDRIIVTVACAAHTHSSTGIRKQGSRLHHWYPASHDPNETAPLLMGAEQAAPSGTLAQ
jgi:hypothetical protein